MPPESYPVAGISLWIDVRFLGVSHQSPRRFLPAKRGKIRKLRQIERQRGLGDEDSETEMEGPTLRMADLKFQNFPDNVPCDGT